MPAVTDRRGLFAAAWAATVALTFALAIVGRGLQHWLESLDLLRWTGLAVVLVLALAVATWAIRIGPRLPRRRAATAVVAAGALLAWGLTFERPEETVHLLLFGAIGVTATLAFGLRAGLPVAVACAGADELLQWYLPDRVGDWPDVTTNTLAGAAGWLIGWTHAGDRDTS